MTDNTLTNITTRGTCATCAHMKYRQGFYGCRMHLCQTTGRPLSCYFARDEFDGADGKCKHWAHVCPTQVGK